MNRSPFPPGARLAAYLRDSGGERQELSIAQQEDAIRLWCNENGHILTHVFKDEARPGSSVVGRAGFQEMMHHFRSSVPGSPGIDKPDCQETGLVIWNFQRFARDIDDAQFHRADLRRRGYVLYSLNDEIPDGPMGRLFEAAIDWKNEQFLIDLSIDVKRGLRSLVERYGAVPGTPPRGFIRQPVDIGERRDGRPHQVHRWAPDPDLAPLVRQAFEMRLAGKSLHEINQATRLYKGLNCFTTFFSNPLYKGELYFGDLAILDYCEPIVDPALWEAVQAIVKRHAAHQNLRANDIDHPRRHASSYLLSGLVFCGRCGSPLFGLNSRQRDGSYHHRYACTRAKRNRDCDAISIPRRFLDQLILDTLKGYVLIPEVLQSLQEQALASDALDMDGLELKRKEENRHLAGLRRQIGRVADAIAESGHSRALLDKLAGLEAEEAEIMSNLVQIERQLSARIPSLDHQDLSDISGILLDRLASSDIGVTRTALRGLVERIVVERDGDQVLGQITYYFPPELQNKSPPEDDTISMSSFQPPLGAPVRRHRFDFPFTAKIIRPYTYRKRIKPSK